MRRSYAGVSANHRGTKNARTKRAPFEPETDQETMSLTVALPVAPALSRTVAVMV